MMNPDDRERTAPFPGPNARRDEPKYRLSPDELRVMRECNRESFYQRCLPISTVLGAATYYAVKTGTLTGNKKYGAVPKVAGAIFVGYLLGKYSYQRKCAEKFMALPNSKIGQLIRARRSGFHDDNNPASVPDISLSPFSGVTDSYSDITPPNDSYDYDSRPSVEGLDDSFRPSVDNPIILQEQEMPPEQKNVTTYDELRKKNREEYEQQRVAIYRQTLKPKAPAKQPPPNKDTEFSEDYTPSAGNKTKYGDTWG